ncbi:hypothetical protein ACLB2K_077526 [Fragaria x ananassa]
MRNSMTSIVRGSIDKPVLATDFMDAISEKYKESNEAEAARLGKEYNELKYSGAGGVGYHIMKLTKLNSWL